MIYRILIVSCFFVVIISSPVRAQWVKVSDLFTHQDVMAVSGFSKEPGHIFAGTRGALYRSKDDGQTWKRVLKLYSSTSEIHNIHVAVGRIGTVFVGTDEGLFRSEDAGRSWKRIFQRPEAKEEKVLATGTLTTSPVILIGTEKGLFASWDEGDLWRRVPALRDSHIYQIDTAAWNENLFLVSSSLGLYVADSSIKEWKKVYDAADADGEEAGNSQFAVEGAPSTRVSPLTFVTHRVKDEILLIHQDTFLRSQDLGLHWEVERAKQLPSRLTNLGAATGEPSKIFLPTEDGIFFHSPDQMNLQRMDWALPTTRIRSLYYQSFTHTLYAGTPQGLFKLTYPETVLYLDSMALQGENRSREILAYFQKEPTIQKLQEVAMRYAEVHPEKISQWRKQASRSAWIPSLNVGYDKGTDETVELDRGGTNDPDTFIIGPKEDDRDFSIDLTWDLSELIWNPDQTSIDNRSKLMVQLREDLLSQLTHLYFARRRLQIKSLLNPTRDLAEEMDLETQIQEYTASIDALTGSYLSRSLE
jgi:photosystem II stability/assembly factor-like uncharacterized protein